MPLNNPFEFFVQLHLTERCNLRCKHCYQSEKRPQEMSLSEITAVIAETSDMLRDWEETYNLSFTSSFNVTGGEPFLRRDLFAVLEKLKENAFDTYILTNGTLVTMDIAAALSALEVEGVQISIEGPKDIHDAIRGTGSFSASLKGIRHLLDAGIELTLNTTLSEMNAPYFMDVVKLASSLGAQRLGFSRLVPSGCGKKMLNTMLKEEVLKDLYTEIFSLNTNGLHITTGDPIAEQLRDPADDDANNPTPSGGCAAGVSGLTVLPDGTVTPCRRLPVPIGNVKKDSLREIWASSETLKALRDKNSYQGKCGECKKWHACRGCRAIAFAYSQANGKADYLAEDPQCFLVN